MVRRLAGPVQRALSDTRRLPARHVGDSSIPILGDFYGGDFERLIEKHGFSPMRMEPRLTKEKIEDIARIVTGGRRGWDTRRQPRYWRAPKGRG